MPKQISLSNCSFVPKYSNSRYLERFVICCSFMKSQGGSQSQSKHTICISPLVHVLSFQLQAAVIVLSFIERHSEGFHGEASQARTRLSGLLWYSCQLCLLCVGGGCQKAGSKGNVKEIHRRAPSFSSLICVYLFVVQHSLFDQHFKCSF